MEAMEKVARHRLSVLQLAQELGSVSAACRQRGMDRNSYYIYKKWFQAQGLEGLKDLPPIHRSHPQSTAPEVVEMILSLAQAHPAYGCNRLESLLKLEGHHVSFVTIQKILTARGLGSRQQRWLALEKEAAATAVEMSTEQIAFLEQQNPVWRERHVESQRPGELLCQDVFFVGHLKSIGKVYLHTVIDSYGSMAWGFLHTSKTPEAAVAPLHNDVLPFFTDHQVPVRTILTDNGREFCGTVHHPYEMYLAFNDIEHRRIRVRHPQTNGFVERFHRTVLEEFFAYKLRETFYESLQALQNDLDAWLHHYNHERPHLGYRNQGRRPYDTFLMAKQPEDKLPDTSSEKL